MTWIAIRYMAVLVTPLIESRIVVRLRRANLLRRSDTSHARNNVEANLGDILVNEISHDRVEVANVSQVLPRYTHMLLVVLAQGHLRHDISGVKGSTKEAACRVVLDIGVLDQL